MKILISLCSFLLLSSLSCKGKEDPLKSYVQSHTDFAFSLYHKLDQEKQGLLFSPYSLGSALTMVYLGAGGETALQMRDALHLKLKPQQIKTASSQLITSLQSKGSPPASYTLNNLSALFVSPTVYLLGSFQEAMEKNFQAISKPANFAEPQEATQTINAAVDKATQGKIPTLFSPSDLNELTRLILVNTLYFEGAFVSPFDPQLTHKEPFFPTPEKKTPALMMEQTFNLLYYENDLVQMGALPFQGKSAKGTQIALVTLMPRSAENFTMMFDEATENLDSWLSALSLRSIHLKIPKWTQSSRFDLNKSLQAMGMKNAFSSQANFSKMTTATDIALNKVVHQVEIMINEKGALATTASGATFGLKGAPLKEVPIPYYLNHPFLYFLVDLKSHELLFMGKYAGPS